VGFGGAVAAGGGGQLRNCGDDNRTVADQRHGVNLYFDASQLCLTIFDIAKYI
jgi:hypothetical protein